MATDLIHDTDEGTAHHALAHVLDFVDDILCTVDLLQQQADVCSCVNLLLSIKK
jgi:hypothetical protein